MITHCKITYFKHTGKYYSEGEFDVPYVNGEPVLFHEALAAVLAEFDAGRRPGLIDGAHFNALITVYTIYGPLSHLFVRGAERMPL